MTYAMLQSAKKRELICTFRHVDYKRIFSSIK